MPWKVTVLARRGTPPVQRPTDAEIVTLLARWAIPPAVARGIALGAGGNVGMAMNEAEEWLQTRPQPEGRGPKADVQRPPVQALQFA